MSSSCYKTVVVQFFFAVIGRKSEVRLLALAARFLPIQAK